MRRLLASLILLMTIPLLARADEAIPRKTLDTLKAATVFIKVDLGRGFASGSGFLIRVAGDTGLLVTNHHVIAAPARTRLAVRTITVVFHSGRKSEQSVRASVLASDPERDLAILEVRGVKELPQPLDLSQKVEPVETMSVYMFGFPFGKALAVKSGNPAITVSKGTVSSIRENDRGEVAAIQIDGDLNPGNSGGPVVDGKGRLVGVAVAKIRNTRIGLAIPPTELTRLLEGRLASLRLTPIKVGEGLAEVKVEARLIDPLHKVRTVSLRFIRADTLTGTPRPDKSGIWAALPGATKVELKIDRQTAVATIQVRATEKGPVRFSFQPEYVSATGRVVWVEPITRAIDFGKVIVAPGPLPVGKVPGPRVTKNSVLDKVRKEADLSVMDLTLEGGRRPRCLCWSDDGKAFFYLGSEGTLRKIGLADLVEEMRLETGHKCGWVSLSAQGLVLAVSDLQEVWVLDARTLKVKRKIAVPSVLQVASAPKLSIAFAATRDGLTALDLRTGMAVKEYTGRDFAGKLVGLGRPVATPDGKFLFTTGGIEQVHRFKIEGQELKFEESSYRIIQGRFEGIDLSVDGTQVCAPSGGGNYANKDHPPLGPYCTYVYAVTDLRKPVVTIKQGPYPLAIGFDPKARLIYAHNFTNDFIVFQANGIKRKEFKLGCGQPRQFLVHPDGYKVVVLGSSKVCCVELPRP